MAHIKKRGDSYLIRVGDGYNLEGKQISKHMTWRPPKGMPPAKADREAKRQSALFEEQVKTGQALDGNIKFADFSERWFRDYAEPQLRPRTVARYRELMTRINPAIGHMYIQSIGPVQLMEFYRQLEDVHKTGKYRCRIDLKAYLKSKHMTKDALSQQADVSLTTLTSIYNGKNVDPAIAERIAEALGKPLGQIFEPAYRLWQLEQQMEHMDIWQNSDRVFTSADGSPMHPDVLSGWFHDFIRTTDLPPIHLHSLRHTNATLAIANGVAVTTVAGQLGHATPATTMKIYAHAIQSAQSAAADLMDDQLNRARTKPRPRCEKREHRSEKNEVITSWSLWQHCRRLPDDQKGTLAQSRFYEFVKPALYCCSCHVMPAFNVE